MWARIVLIVKGLTIQPEEGFILSRGFRLHYLQWGQKGLPLVLLHSMRMDAHSFDAFSTAVSDEYRILALDLLDHGDSEKPKRTVGLEEHMEIVREAYRQLGFTHNVLIGHSIGGMLGMVLAAAYPDDLLGLVLVDIAPFDTGRPRMTSPPESFANENEARGYIRLRYPKFTEEAIENRMKNAFQRLPNGRLSFKGTGEAIRGGINVDLWQFVSRIRTPTLLLVAGESMPAMPGEQERIRIVTPEALTRMRSLIHEFKTITVEGATHMIPQDRPKEFEREVRSFLATIKGSNSRIN